MLSNGIPGIYVNIHIFALLSTLARELSFCNGQRLTHRFITGQSAEYNYVFSYRRITYTNLPPKGVRRWKRGQKSRRGSKSWKMGSCETLTSERGMTVGYINSQHLWSPAQNPHKIKPIKIPAPEVLPWQRSSWQLLVAERGRGTLLWAPGCQAGCQCPSG